MCTMCLQVDPPLASVQTPDPTVTAYSHTTPIEPDPGQGFGIWDGEEGNALLGPRLLGGVGGRVHHAPAPVAVVGELDGVGLRAAHGR